LREFGVNKLADLEALLSDDFLVSLKEHITSSTPIGILRKAMMYADIDRYFTSAWQNHWREITRSSLRMLRSKYGEDKVEELLQTYKLNPQKARSRKRAHASRRPPNISSNPTLQ